MRTVTATRYVLPLREGGSLPAIVEADDLGMYVVKFRGAGQGRPALVAELVAGEIARALGLPVPELVLVEIDPVLGRNDPDAEIRDLLKASTGVNVGLDYLPGSTDFVAAAGDSVPPLTASLTIWFDSFVQNVDRTPRNPNLLMWHREPYLIDHGAAMYFHHNWETMPSKARSPFSPIENHVLLPLATEMQQAAVVARGRLHQDVLSDVLAMVPDEYLGDDAADRRATYLRFFVERLEHADIFEQEVTRARERQL